MSRDHDDGALRTWMWLLGMALGLLLVGMMVSGCGSTKYVPVETVRTEYQDNIREIHTIDSVMNTHFVYINGDTVIDWRDRIRWRDRLVHDSIYIERNDTIREPYPMERELTRWEQTKMDLGGMAMGVCLGLLCVAVVWLIRKFRR